MQLVHVQMIPVSVDRIVFELGYHVGNDHIKYRRRVMSVERAGRVWTLATRRIRKLTH